jgi:uncharacterized coiled-coil DUF342 family protein
MGEAKRIREKIDGLREQIEAHLAKIRAELDKKTPNYPRIAHWEGEIRGWQTRIQTLEARLKRRRRRGR